LRIPLSVRNFYSGRKVVFADFFIQIPSMRVARAHSAVVDSGSPFTSISTRDAIDFGLPIKHTQGEEITQLAGFKFYSHFLTATFVFRDAEQKPFRFTGQKVRVLIPTKLDKPTLREVQDIPSLIGTDFIEDNRLTFVYNPSTLTAYFERAEPEPLILTPTNQSGTTS